MSKDLKALFYGSEEASAAPEVVIIAPSAPVEGALINLPSQSSSPTASDAEEPEEHWGLEAETAVPAQKRGGSSSTSGSSTDSDADEKPRPLTTGGAGGGFDTDFYSAVRF